MEKTNFQMIREIQNHYKTYKDEITHGILDVREIEKIDSIFELKERKLLDLQNLRDFVVAVLCQKSPDADTFTKDERQNWDLMSAITCRIDNRKIQLGGEL